MYKSKMNVLFYIYTSKATNAKKMLLHYTFVHRNMIKRRGGSDQIKNIGFYRFYRSFKKKIGPL